nr:hypothetical protein [Maliibacterium massiliense]
MKNKLLRVPLVSLGTGILLTVIETVAAYTLGRQGGSTTPLIWVMLLCSAALYVLCGILFFRDMTWGDTAKSAGLVVAYAVAMVLVEQLFLAGGSYPAVLLWMFIPLRMYLSVHQALLFLTWTPSIWYVALSCLAPLLFVPWARLRRGTGSAKQPG